MLFNDGKPVTSGIPEIGAGIFTIHKFANYAKIGVDDKD